jgi:Ala-tRNA(Pro) deacylase
MAVINRWLEYLDRKHVRYSHSMHPAAHTARQTADAERVRPHDFAKTVVYFGSTGFGIAVVPADAFVDLEKVCGVLGLSYVGLASEADLAKLFPDCELGAMPPFGDACELPVVMDTGISGDFIAFTIGTHRDAVRMSFADFQRLAKPAVASIAMPQEVLV